MVVLSPQRWQRYAAGAVCLSIQLTATRGLYTAFQDQILTVAGSAPYAAAGFVTLSRDATAIPPRKRHGSTLMAPTFRRFGGAATLISNLRHSYLGAAIIRR